MILALLFSLFSLSGWPQDSICGRFEFNGSAHFKLTEPQKKLICGDPAREAWENIPTNQAIPFLRSFLQQQGFHHPLFETKNGKILVELGEKTKVREFDLTSNDTLRGIVGETLTPELLDDITRRLTHHLRANGYACPKVDVSADPNTGRVTVSFKGDPKTIGRIEREKIEGIDEEVPSRYDAFRVGDPFNVDYLDLAVRRTLSDGLAQSSIFTTTCEGDTVSLTQRLVAGTSRVIRLAVGFDTERYILLRGAWKNSRLGKRGSLVEAVGVATLKDQELRLTSSLYYSSFNRHYLHLETSLRHENIDPYEILAAKIEVAPALKLDSQDVGYTFQVGPQLNLQRKLRGIGPDFSRFISLVVGARATDHYFEFYQGSPRKGGEYTLNFDLTAPPFSPVSAQSISLTAERLWNLGSFDPPFLVLGVRGRIAATLSSEPNSNLSALPTSYRMFLGGSKDLKGFGYNELPGSPLGALTLFYLGTEARFTDLLPWGLQPIVFVDGASLGDKAQLSTNLLYWDIGGGLRWETFIGSFRTTLAHGFVDPGQGNEAHSHWQFYLSFGEEF